MITDIWIETYDGTPWLHTDEEPVWRPKPWNCPDSLGSWQGDISMVGNLIELHGTALACCLPRGMNGALHHMTRGGPLGAAVTFAPEETYGLPLHVFDAICVNGEPAHFHLEQTKFGINRSETGE